MGIIIYNIFQTLNKIGLTREGFPILNASEKFSRRDNYKKSILKPPDYYGRCEELED